MGGPLRFCYPSYLWVTVLGRGGESLEDGTSASLIHFAVHLSSSFVFCGGIAVLPIFGSFLRELFYSS